MTARYEPGRVHQRTSRNEVLKQGLHALAKEFEPYVYEVMDSLAKAKEQQ